jgi:hypothetical protein
VCVSVSVGVCVRVVVGEASRKRLLKETARGCCEGVSECGRVDVCVGVWDCGKKAACVHKVRGFSCLLLLRVDWQMR